MPLYNLSYEEEKAGTANAGNGVSFEFEVASPARQAKGQQAKAMTDLIQALNEQEAYSARLGVEAAYYWKRHYPRYDYIMRVLMQLGRTHPPQSILDVGMGFQTLLVRKFFPESAIDCAGIAEDARFRPDGAFRFHSLDLNDTGICDDPCPSLGRTYDLIIFMEVLEHLFTPPDVVLRYLASRLSRGGTLIVTTPNAAWLKNRIKMLFGKNPFEGLRLDRKDMGHIREYTKCELEAALRAAGLSEIAFARRGLYRFSGLKDRVYSSLADLTHPSLSRSIVAVCERG